MRGNKRRSLPDKQIAPNMSNSHMKVMMKSCKTGISAPCHSSVHSNNKTQEHYRVSQKTKRLKTIKQRNLIRGQNSNRSNQHRQQYERGRKDVKCQDCQSSCSVNLFRKEKPVAKPFHSQKPSLITEGRLTSIRGLFSHEVRSVNIERLVKEKKHQKQEGQPTASHSSSPSCLIPNSTLPAVVSETSEEGISACASKDQGLMPIEQTDCIQTNLEDIVPLTMPSGDGTHNCAQIHRATPKTSRSESPLDHKSITEAVILSSSENELFHKSLTTSISPCDHKVIPKKKIRHDQKQTNKAAAVYVKHDLVNPKRLDTPVGSEFFKVDSPQFLNAQLDAPSPASFMFSSPTPDSKRSALGDESQHRNPVFSSKEEAVSRLASGLCHSLDSFPLQRCRPLLTECRKVLLHQLQERHGSQLQHSLRRLHSHISADGPRSSSDPTEQVWPSSEQNYLGNKQMYSIFTRNHEFDQQSETAEFQTDNGSQNHCLQEGFCENVNVGSASKRQRKLTWETHSSQDSFRKLRRPCQDTMSQWSITAPSQDTLRAKQHSSSHMFSLHQAFTEPQMSTPVSYPSTNRTLDPFFLEPQKQVKVGSGESGRRHGNTLPLLEQWRNDPDLNFLFQDENLEKSHSALGPLRELRSCSPHHETESVGVKPHFGAFSSISAFFPPEGFCYEPYYQFPHPSNSFKNLP